MNETDTPIKDILIGKRVLFVEDRPTTISSYREELEITPRVKTEYVESLEDAWAIFEPNKKSPPYDIVLIDLNIPPIPRVLSPYAERLNAFELNEGQALGLWLSEHCPQVPYAYLTALPVVVDRKVDPSQAGIIIINKNTLMPDDFPTELCKVWAQWDGKR